ncbi:MAG: hypothetical protein HYV26_22680, partial [Candidatus Hydrogenedentes bacterium]|nr:hypothetical protein [Candidatus Hydrogenedentota bacterium]
MLRLQSYLRATRLLPYACLFMAPAPAQESVLDREITVCIESPQGYHEAFQLLQEQYLELILCFECALLPEDPIVPTIDLQSVTVAEALDGITAALEPV